MRALILGRTGQLARELARAPTALTLTFAGRDRAELTRPETAVAMVEAEQPELVILAAAYTHVDRAEAEPEAARLANAEAPRAIAEACARAGAALVHVSTDCVFDGTKPTAYVEMDPVNPLGVYGRTKAAGEQGVLESGARAAVVRTSWVFGPYGSNFIQLMLRLSQERDEVRVVCDQFARPTAGADLARAALDLGGRLARGDAGTEGLFHFAGADDASRVELAQAVFAGAAARGGRAIPVTPITTAEYPTPARRPLNARLDSGRINALGVASRPWREALDLCLDEMLGPAEGGPR
jgi:dTDP-4-dehydrorhamnose reductase